MAEWVHIRERLPDPEQPVLIYGDGGYCVGYRNNVGQWICEITRPRWWMPLPETPDGAERSGDRSIREEALSPRKQ